MEAGVEYRGRTPLRLGPALSRADLDAARVSDRGGAPRYSAQSARTTRGFRPVHGEIDCEWTKPHRTTDSKGRSAGKDHAPGATTEIRFGVATGGCIVAQFRSSAGGEVAAGADQESGDEQSGCRCTESSWRQVECLAGWPGETRTTGCAGP